MGTTYLCYNYMYNESPSTVYKQTSDSLKVAQFRKRAA